MKYQITFTKEELEEIYEELDACECDHGFNSPALLDFINKLFEICKPEEYQEIKKIIEERNN